MNYILVMFKTVLNVNENIFCWNCGLKFGIIRIILDEFINIKIQSISNYRKISSIFIEYCRSNSFIVRFVEQATWYMLLYPGWSRSWQMQDVIRISTSRSPMSFGSPTRHAIAYIWNLIQLYYYYNMSLKTH